MSVVTPHFEVVDMNDSEASDLFDQITQRQLQISGSEFIRQWNNGDYADVDVDSVPGLAQVVTALPFAGIRSTST